MHSIPTPSITAYLAQTNELTEAIKAYRHAREKLNKTSVWKRNFGSKSKTILALTSEIDVHLNEIPPLYNAYNSTARPNLTSVAHIELMDHAQAFFDATIENITAYKKLISYNKLGFWGQFAKLNSINNALKVLQKSDQEWFNKSKLFTKSVEAIKAQTK